MNKPLEFEKPPNIEDEVLVYVEGMPKIGKVAVIGEKDGDEIMFVRFQGELIEVKSCEVQLINPSRKRFFRLHKDK